MKHYYDDDDYYCYYDDDDDAGFVPPEDKPLCDSSGTVPRSGQQSMRAILQATRADNSVHTSVPLAGYLMT